METPVIFVPIGIVLYIIGAASHSLSKAEFNITTKEFKYEVNNPFIDKIDKLINDRIEQIIKFYE